MCSCRPPGSWGRRIAMCLRLYLGLYCKSSPDFDTCSPTPKKRGGGGSVSLEFCSWRSSEGNCEQKPWVHADGGRGREQLTTRHYRLSFLWKQRKAWVWERSAMSWDVQSLISVLGNVWKGYLSMQCSQESKRDEDKKIPAESKSSRKQGDAE